MLSLARLSNDLHGFINMLPSLFFCCHKFHPNITLCKTRPLLKFQIHMCLKVFFPPKFWLYCENLWVCRCSTTYITQVHTEKWFGAWWLDLTSDGCYRCVTFQNGHVDICADLRGITTWLGAAALCWLQVITAVSAGDWRRHRGHQAGQGQEQEEDARHGCN